MRLVNVEEMHRIEQATDAAGQSYAAMMDLAEATCQIRELAPMASSGVASLNLALEFFSPKAVATGS